MCDMAFTYIRYLSFLIGLALKFDWLYSINAEKTRYLPDNQRLFYTLHAECNCFMSSLFACQLFKTSYMTIAAATDALSEDTFPFSGIDTI